MSAVHTEGKSCDLCGEDYVNEAHMVRDTALVRDVETGAVFKRIIIWPCVHAYCEYEKMNPITEKDVREAEASVRLFIRKSPPSAHKRTIYRKRKT